MTTGRAAATTNTGNNNTNIYNPLNNSLARGNNMNRSRWYSTSTTLLNGEIYIQGGTSGGDRPEIRANDGTLRLLSNVNTSGYSETYPRNFLAPDGRVFGFDNSGKMYYINPAGTGLLTTAGQLPGATNWTASAAMFQPGRIIQMGGASSAALVIDINGVQPVGDRHAVHVHAAPVGVRDRVARWPRARHRRQRRRESAQRRQQRRRALESGHGHLDAGRHGHQCAPVSLLRAAAARCHACWWAAAVLPARW